MKPIISDKILLDAVVKELEADPEVVARHISVTATDGAITLRGHSRETTKSMSPCEQPSACPP
jgi:osmotically-inducible protein OsmY